MLSEGGSSHTRHIFVFVVAFVQDKGGRTTLVGALKILVFCSNIVVYLVLLFPIVQCRSFFRRASNLK